MTQREDAEYLCHLAEAEFRSGDREAAQRIAAEATALVDGSQPRLRDRLQAAAARYR